MKKLLGILALMTALMPIANTVKAERKEGTIIDKTSQAVDFSQTVDVSDYETLSIQAISTVSIPSGHTLNTGNKESATITIVSTSSQLMSTRSTATVTVVSTTGVLGDSLTLNGIVFKEGTNWSIGTSTSLSALNLAAKIDADSNFVATAAGSTVTIYSQSTGSFSNAWPVLTTDAVNLKISGATFTLGKNQHTITVNGTTLTEGIDFRADTSSQTTAHNIVVAVNANTTLNAQVLASSAAAVVTLTALYPGVQNYYVVSSTSGFDAVTFSPGAASKINLQTDTLSQTSHGLTTGMKVLFATVTASVAPGGLTNQTTYFAIKLTDNQYKLASSALNAAGGTAVDITSLPTSNSTYTVTASTIILASNTGWYWQSSNDNVNFSTTSISSFTFSTFGSVSGGTILTDLASYAYKYLRMVFAGPTQGGVSISVRAYGKEE